MRAVNHQLAVELAQGRPRGFTGGLQGARHIVVAGVLYVCADAELALPGVQKRQLAEVALDLEFHIAGRTRHHRFAHIVARWASQAQGQVAVHPCAVGAGQAALQIEHTGKARAAPGFVWRSGFPVDLGFTLGIRVAERQVGHLHRQPRVTELPAHVRRQLIQRQHRFLKNAGQVQAAPGHFQAGLAGGLVEVKVHVRPTQTR